MAQSHSLTTVSRQKIFMKQSTGLDETLLESLIDAVTDFVERYCGGRRFQQQAISNEIYDGSGTKKLLLKNFPVVSGETFTLEERDSTDNSSSSFSSIDSDFFFVKESAGIVEFVNQIFRDLPQHYRITYTAGYDFNLTTKTLVSVGIGDLEWAVWRLVEEAYDASQSGKIKSESIGDYSVTFQDVLMMNPQVRMAVDKFIRPAF